MNEYDKQANDFAAKYGVKLTVLDKEYRTYFVDDKDERWVYKCRLSRNRKPRLYDIFSCLTKYDPGTFENFCWEYGYDEDSRKAERIYNGVVKEWKAVERLFGDCLEALQEIN